MTDKQLQRYSRHILLEEIGEQGQEKLLRSKVLIIGAGGLGSPAALYLAAAGVGTIGIADGDHVSLSNLQRQILHNSSDVWKRKVDSAAEKLSALNPELKLETYPFFIDEHKVEEVISGYDFVLDCTDGFASKYLINDACTLLGKAFCFGGIVRFRGQVMTHIPGSACYRCIFPEPPEGKEVETCARVGVLGSVAGIAGTIQASEAIKYLTGAGSLLTDSLLTYDALTMEFSKIVLTRNPDCALCGEHPTIREIREYSIDPCRKREQ